MGNWKDILGVVAPAIASSVGTPLFGVAVKALTSTLLGDSKDPSEKDLFKAIENATPEQLHLIKEADNEFLLKMKSLDIDLQALHNKDRANARELQLTTKSLIVPSLSVITVVGFFGLVYYLVTGNISMDNTLLGIVIGHVASKAEQVYNFYYGSSEGSKRKDIIHGK